MSFVIITAVLVSAGLIVNILTNPHISVKGIHIRIFYWMVPLFGALVLILSRHLTFSEIFRGLTGATGMNPLKILVLFISMTLLSIYLDEAGMFRYLAITTLKHAGQSQKRLFLYLYLCVSVLTVFTSNDIIILTFTPFICYFSKNAKINPVPYLFGEFVAANTFSLMFIIGNPTNIYLAASAGLGFFEYLKLSWLPTIVSGTVAYLCLILMFNKDLCKPMEISDTSCTLEDKGLVTIGVIHLGLCTVLLVISSYVNLEMWLITLSFAVSLFVCTMLYRLITRNKKRPGPAPRTEHLLLHTLRRAPWELIPFVLSMFLIVLSLEKYGVTALIADFFGEDMTILKYGLSSFLAANLMNNIPMSVLFSSITSGLSGLTAERAVFSAVIGSNLGAYFTPLGALAGIMWSDILKKTGVDFSFRKYVRLGAPISFIVLAAALVSLSIVL